MMKVDPPIISEQEELGRWVLQRAAGSERFLVGLTGPPGVGKSTVAAHLAEQLPGTSPIVSMDGFHMAHDLLEEKRMVDRKGAPETFDVWGFVALLERIRHHGDGETILAPRYDRLAKNPVGSAISIGVDERMVLVEGNYLLLSEHPWSRVRPLLDVVVYLETETDRRIERLVERHVWAGKEPEQAREFVMRSDEANAALIEKTRENTDAVLLL